MEYLKVTYGGEMTRTQYVIAWIAIHLSPGRTDISLKELDVVSRLVELDEHGVVTRVVGLDREGKAITAEPWDDEEGGFVGEEYTTRRSGVVAGQLMERIERQEFERAWAAILP